MTVENLTITVKTNADKAALKLDTLTRAIDKVQVSANGLSGGAITNLTALANAMNTIAGLSITTKAFTGLANGLSKLADAAILITSDVIYNLERVVNVLSKLQGVNLNGVGAALNGVSRAANKVGASTRTASAGIKEVGKAANKAQTPLGNFLASLKRIAYYRIIRGIIKSITQAFKEGLENAYEYSREVGGELAPALDRIASASAKMKNQLGAAFGQLIIALEPVIVAIINLVTKLATAITWLFALLSGSDTYLVANDITKSWKDTEDATKKATGAAKEYKNQLLGFDEINRLNAPSNGGGGGSAGEDYSGLFHEEKMNWHLPDISGWLAGIGAAIPPTLDAMAQLIEQFVTVGETAEETSTSTQNAWERICITIEQKATEAATDLQGDWGRITTATQGAWSTVVSWTQGAWSTVTGTITSWTEQAKNNIVTFTTETIPAWKRWAQNVGVMAAQAFTNVATSVYQGLQSAADNVVTFVNATAQGLHTWAQGALNNIASWASGVAQTVGAALQSAWESFKNFMQATGQAISTWWGQNKGWVVPTAIAAAVVIGAIALAPATGGASLGAIALAANGGSFPNDGNLFIAGEEGPEIVANMGNRSGVMNIEQMHEAVRQGVYEAMTAANANGNSDVSVKVYLDSREIRAGQERLARAWG